MDWGDEYSYNSFDVDCLLNSFPGDVEFEQIFSDIDEKIEKNAASLKQCLKDIQSEVNKRCGSDVPLQTTSDCLEWLNNYSSSSLKPPSCPHGDLIKFLKTLQDLLKNEQNQEEMILDFLLDLSSQCGVSFPRTPSGTSFLFTSRTSLHAVEDHSSMDVKSLWDDIRLHLRRFLLNKLQGHDKVNNSPQTISFKTHCIQQLLFLYPESEVLAKYQSLQNKMVIQLLENCFLSYNREANLDTVMHGYQNSILKLCKMIKQDFYVLSEILAPSSALKFINETYLDSIKEEMTNFLERFCELQFKENTVHVVKTGRSSSKHRGAVHALVTHECPRKGRNICLSLYELKFLSQLIKPLLKLEKEVQDLSQELLLKPRVSRHTSGVWKKSSGELLIQEGRANENSILPEKLMQVKEYSLLDFGWRNAFKEVSLSVVRCLTIAMEDLATKILHREQNEKSSAVNYTMSLVNIQSVWELYRAALEEEQPKKIAKFCSDIMEELDMMLPLALACRDGSLQEIRANFVEACCKVATAVLARLEERSKEVPSKVPLQNLCTLLSTAIFVFQHFMHYDDLMKETSKKPLFLVPVQRYQELISTLQFQVTDYCVRVCATSILQDAESHHWDDYKAFYEGERCSFSIQMWHYFCCALHHDLWAVLPPKLAQEILIDVLEKSLDLLASRYSQAHPSYKRTPQIRFDVTAILICTEQMLWSVCRSVQELLNPRECINEKILKIHAHCNNLFTTMVILTSPLTELYKTYQNDTDDLPSDSSESPFNQPLHWISCIEHFSPSFLRTPSAGEMAVQGRLKLLLSQPCCNWNLLLETLLQDDCLILKILLRSEFSVEGTLSKYEEKVPNLGKMPNHEPSLTEAIFKLLSHCSLSPQSLGRVFLNYMELEQLWDFLYDIPVKSNMESEPEIIRCLKQTLIETVKSIIKQITSLLTSWEAGGNCSTYPHKPVPESLLKMVPKEWSYNPKEMKRKEMGKGFTRFAAQAVSIVISKLPTMIACLPPPIKYFFFLSERKMSKNFVELKKTGLLVWNLIVIICRIVEDGNTLELLTGASFDSWSKEKLSLVCVCLESILGKQKSSPNQVTQRVIHSIEQQKPNWIESQLLKARKLSTECVLMAVEEATALEEGGIALELTEQKINMMVLDICHKPGGSEYLRQIYHIIRLNEEYLKEQLFSMNVAEENTLPTRPLKVTLKSLEKQPPAFNPFQVYKWFSEKMLDQSVITKWDWNWSNLLPSYLGLNKTTFRALLKNSICLQPSKVLQDGVKKKGNNYK
uniref:KIAA0825 n=1 Tax=Monodelphis domestica TaxID=13616 RepID=A0A5F8GCN8_MONDO